MRAHPGSTFRKVGALATGVVALALVAACSNASSSPGAATRATQPAAANPSQILTPTPVVAPVATPATTPAASPISHVTTLAEAANHYVTCPDGTPDDCLISGTYGLGSDVVPTAASQVVVPAGWFEWDMGPGTVGLLVERTDAKDGSGWGVLFSSFGVVSRDPCNATKGTFPAGSTSSVDGLIAAMRSWPGFQIGAPRSVAIGGASGKQVAVTSTRTNATCPAPVIWQTPQGTGFNGYPMVGDKPKGYTAQFLILDVNGELLVLRTTDFPETTSTELGQGIAPVPRRHVADQRTLHAILDSLRFGQDS